MKKNLFFAILYLFIAVNAYAQETPSLTKLTEHVYAYIGITQASPSGNSYGANCGVVIGSESVMVIDTLISAKHAGKLITDIKKITDKPIKYVVNTHYHLDHSWGNSAFAKLGSVIIAQKNIPLTKEQIKQIMAHPEPYGLTAQDLAGTTAKLPDIFFDTSLKVDLGGVTVNLHYPGPSHSIDSIIAHVNGDNVVFAGDIIFNRYHPFLGEGDIKGWIGVLSQLEKLKAKVIVPGHGPAAAMSDIKEMSIYLREFDRNARRLTKNKTQADAPSIAKKLILALPDQKRTELSSLIEMNLRMKYLPEDKSEKKEDPGSYK
jgi:glyoxylase-like metal-dependent hydrolase (beta-lactamase superfamily II)